MGWTHLSDTTPRARKRHTCELCGMPIAIGVRHVARRGIGEDGPVTFRMHNQCDRATAGWDEYDWESAYDTLAFREEDLTPEALVAIERENGVVAEG